MGSPVRTTGRLRPMELVSCQPFDDSLVPFGGCRGQMPVPLQNQIPCPGGCSRFFQGIYVLLYRSHMNHRSGFHARTLRTIFPDPHNQKLSPCRSAWGFLLAPMSACLSTLREWIIIAVMMGAGINEGKRSMRQMAHQEALSIREPAV